MITLGEVIFSMGLPMVCAYLLLSCLVKETPFAGYSILIPLSIGSGIALSSVVHIAVFMAAGPPGVLRGILELAVFSILILGSVLCLFLGRDGLRAPDVREASGMAASLRERTAQWGFVLAAAFSILLFCLISMKAPHGGWDAWAIWNLKARFLFRGGEVWTNAFSPLIDWSHPDYPLLLPGAISFLWHGGSSEAVEGPILIAFLFTCAAAALLVSALGALKGRIAGYLAGILLLGTLGFIPLGASQYADIPLAFFILAAVVCTSYYAREDPGGRAWLPAAGAMAGCAAWTKNEGILFLAALFLGWMIVGLRRSGIRRTLKEVSLLLSGAWPFLILLGWFKFKFAPPGDLFIGRDLHVLDAARHWLILKAFLWESLKMGAPLLLGAGILLVRREPPPFQPAARAVGWIALGLTLAGYYAVYLITPYDLSWHLSTSAGRLLMQLWPAALFLSVLRLRLDGSSR